MERKQASEKIRVYHCSESDSLSGVAEVILRAFPHLVSRMETFMTHGARWHRATPVVCETGGQAVSTAVIFHRELWVGKRKAWFPGIGAVATIPEARGKGYASLVMKYCEQYSREQGYYVAVLFCTIVDFYRKLGWSPIPEDFVEFTMAGPISTMGLENYRLSHFDAGSISPALQKLYQNVQPEGSGATVRDGGIYDEYSRWPRYQSDLAWIAYLKNRPVAYVHGKRSVRGGILLMEATCQGGHEQALILLLNRQMQVVSPEERVTFEGVLSPEHPLFKILPGIGVKPTWRKTGADTSTMMIKSLRDSEHNDGSSSRKVGKKFLTADDFQNQLPWQPRTWWAVDRF